jgi:hypothetical protein
LISVGWQSDLSERGSHLSSVLCGKLRGTRANPPHSSGFTEDFSMRKCASTAWSS